MRLLTDTNILLRWVQRQAPESPLTSAAIRVVRRRGDELVISPQNVVEFWHVASRPVPANGLGLAPGRVDQLAKRLDRVFKLLPDTPAVHQEWRQLVVNILVQGRQVYDARLAAVMYAHGISHILTFNTTDFARYPGITAVHPQDVAATP